MTTRACLIGIDEALRVYGRLPPALHAGTLHPLYVLADACRHADLKPTFWLYENDGEVLLHGFHLSSIPGTGWSDLQSPYGYGGPLATTTDGAFIQASDDAFLDWARENEVVAEFLRFHPMLENWRFYPGLHDFDRKTVWVECTEPDLLMTYETRQRTAIRKAIKQGVQVKWLTKEELHSIFPAFYREAMRAIAADDFYFFPDDYFQGLLSLPFVSGAAALLGTEVIAMSLFLNEGISEYHLSGKRADGARYSASNFLLHEAFRESYRKGIKKMHLGGGSTPQPDDTLLFFKAGFSHRQAEFRIGRRVIIAAAYEQLKQRYAERYAQHPQRILFYRS